MILNLHSDAQQPSFCHLTYDKAEGWLQASWKGCLAPHHARHYAEAYLHYAGQHPSPYLLNHNELLQGTWFDGLEWLAEVWLPQAICLGLRYVAHVVQADLHTDSFSARLLEDLLFELQVFQNGADARHWLRQQRDATLLLAGELESSQAF